MVKTVSDSIQKDSGADFGFLFGAPRAAFLPFQPWVARVCLSS